MKKKLILVLTMLLCSIAVINPTSAQGIKFETCTFSEGLAMAKKANKLLFVDCYTSWCGPCKQMAKEVFILENVGQFFNQNYINMKIDMEKGEGKDIAKKYSVSSFPTFLILMPDGSEMNRFVGSCSSDEFIKKIKEASDPKNSPAIMKKKFDDGERDIAFVDSYLKKLGERYQTVETLRVLEIMFPLMNNEQRFKSEYMSSYYEIPTFNSIIINYIVDNQQAIEKYMSPDMVKGLASNALGWYIINIGACNIPYDKKEFDAAMKFAKKAGIEKDAAIVSLIKASKFGIKKDCDKLLETCIYEYQFGGGGKPLFNQLYHMINGHKANFNEAQKAKLKEYEKTFKGNTMQHL